MGEAVANAGYVVLVADENMRYLAASDAACELLGYGREELIGLSVPDLVVESNASAIRRVRSSPSTTRNSHTSLQGRSPPPSPLRRPPNRGRRTALLRLRALGRRVKLEDSPASLRGDSGTLAQATTLFPGPAAPGAGMERLVVRLGGELPPSRTTVWSCCRLFCDCASSVVRSGCALACRGRSLNRVPLR